MRTATLHLTAYATAYTVLTTDSLAITIGCGVTSLGLAVQSMRAVFATR